MAYTDAPDVAAPHISPALIVGAASPLWGYFGACAAGGVAYWWMTRWAQPANLEAMFDRTLKAMTPPAAPEAVFEAAEDTVRTVLEAVESALPVAEPEPTAIVEAEAAPEPEVTLDAAPRPKAKKLPAPDAEA